MGRALTSSRILGTRQLWGNTRQSINPSETWSAKEAATPLLLEPTHSQSAHRTSTSSVQVRPPNHSPNLGNHSPPNPNQFTPNPPKPSAHRSSSQAPTNGFRKSSKDQNIPNFTTTVPSITGTWLHRRILH